MIRYVYYFLVSYRVSFKLEIGLIMNLYQKQKSVFSFALLFALIGWSTVKSALVVLFTDIRLSFFLFTEHMCDCYQVHRSPGEPAGPP